MRILGRIVSLLILSIGSIVAQQINDWENPAVIAINKLPARATMYSFASEKEALEGDRKKSNRVLSLNGEWQFNFSPSIEASPTNFLDKKFDDWKPIKVPMNWEMQGFGDPIYTNQTHSWEHQNWPKISPVNNPIGIYKKEFNIPTNWSNKKVRIHFGGVTSAFYIWINGKKVGYSQGSRTPAEFDITPFIEKGKNTVFLKVFRWCDGSYVEAQDHWDLSGIHRDVLLLAEPKASISDFKIETTLDKQYKDAVLKVSPFVKLEKGLNAKDYIITTQLYNENTLVVSEKTEAEVVTNFHFGQRWHPKYDIFNIAVSNPKKWSAEQPNLYTLVLSLKDKKGNILESKSCKVGFRSYEEKKGVFLVNGKAVKLYGVNRHDHNAKTGKAVSYADMKRDIMLMKQYNFNAVRTSHYPNNPEFYDLCDQYGIYVMDEANIETHGTRGFGGELANNPQWTNTFIDRAIRMYQRDKNHPSIFSWSLGNESGCGSNHSAMAGYLKWNDPERLIHYEGAESYGGKLSPQSKNTPQDPFDFTDMISRMYPTPEEFAEMDDTQLGEKMVISCEYTHAMGNSNGGLKLFWDVAHSHPRIAGGFIWDWMDQGIEVTTDDGCLQYAYGGYFREKGYTDYNFCLNGVINADQTPKPAMEECKYVFQPFEFSKLDYKNNTFYIKNRQAFTSSNVYHFSFEVLENGNVIKKGILKVESIAPATSKTISFPSFTRKLGKEYLLNVYAKNKIANEWQKAGSIIASEQFVYPYAKSSEFIENENKPSKLIVNKTMYGVEVSNKNMSITFDAKTGYLSKLISKGNHLLLSPIKPNFWRATTDNDRAIIQRNKGINFWKEATNKQQLLSFNHSSNGESVSVETKYQLGGKEVFYSIGYKIHSNGTIEIDNQFECKGKLENIPRIGLQTQIKDSFSTVNWYGKGPYENYVDRNEAAFIGNYKSKLEGFSQPYVYPQAYANRSGVRYVGFYGADNSLILEGNNKNFEFSIYPYDTMALDKAGYLCELQKLKGYTINIDYKQQGVAGYNSWSWKAAPRPEHSIPAKNYSFKFRLIVK